MEHILQVQKREISTKRYVKNLRKQGEIPAIIYGNHKEPMPIMINARMFRKQFSHISESIIITLEIPGEVSKEVLIKEYDHSIINNTLVHIDFYEIEKGKKLRTNVNVSLIGNAEGIRLGGILEHFLHEIEVECLPKDLPEVIEYNVEHLNIGDGFYVNNLPPIEGVKYITSEDLMVAQVIAPRQILETDDEKGEEEEDESTDEENEKSSEE